MERRSRSGTGASQRPPSRDSTASLQSVPRLMPADSIPQHHSDSQPHAQHYRPQSQQYDHQFAVMPPQQYPQHSLPMGTDPSQQYHTPSIQTQSQMFHSHSMSTYPDHHGLPGSQPSTMQYAQAGTDADESKKRTGAGSAANQSNERELREALERNRHRTLQDVAREVTEAERTSRAEKTKQLFAMLWLSNSCEPAKTSVPRSRVYSSYADRCATEKVQPLNPASFGKLVRIIFKGIATRRLGVRGESKYHYVDLALKSEKEQIETSQVAQSPASMAIDFNNLPTLSASAHFPVAESPLGSPRLPPQRDLGEADAAVFAEPFSTEYKPYQTYSTTYPVYYRFPQLEDDVFDDDIELPDLWPFAPDRADLDAAQALKSLYRVHCTSLIEYFKKCKEKQFWKMFATFQGTLTVPVQKLFTSPSMAAWIRECDYYMYQRMLSFLGPVALQVLPVNALKFFDNVVKGLQQMLLKTFQGMPMHVVEARLEPATRFTELVNRMLKVNNAAHAASQVLENDEGRQLLYEEWVGKMNPKRLMEGELPGCGYEETLNILTKDIPALLRPLAPPPVYEDGLPYAVPNAQVDANDNYIDRIDGLLRSLPRRFPNASARLIVTCVKNLGTAAMRDFTMQSAQSFHAWWIVKIFVDEYSQWLISSGGFLAHRPRMPGQVSPGAASIANGPVESGAEDHSRLGSVALGDTNMRNGGPAQTLRKRSSDDFDNEHVDTKQDTKRTRLTPPTTDAPHFEQPHPSFATSFGSVNAVTFDTTDIDDSGIGLGLLGEETHESGKGKKLVVVMDRAPLMENFADAESTAAVAI